MTTYYNKKTAEYYYEGSSMTRRLNDGRIFAGVPNEEQLAEWGFVPYVPPVPERTLEIAKSEKIAQIVSRLNNGESLEPLHHDGNETYQKLLQLKENR